MKGPRSGEIVNFHEFAHIDDCAAVFFHLGQGSGGIDTAKVCAGFSHKFEYCFHHSFSLSKFVRQ
jgi:hypothetical protein